MVRVLVVEDNDVFRDALEVVLGLTPDLEVAAAAADAASALEACAAGCPDVALVDYRLPDRDGVELTRELRARCPAARVLALTAAADAPEVAALLDAGAVACLGKDLALGEIVASIREAAAGARDR
jgi:DNA-binding NarL/FixJ family response regulator